jgi:hypothetical protein
MPTEYFYSFLGQIPLPPEEPVPEEELYCCSATSFWKVQSKFELVFRLYAALDSRGDHYKKIKQVLATTGIEWKIEGTDAEKQFINLT